MSDEQKQAKEELSFTITSPLPSGQLTPGIFISPDAFDGARFLNIPAELFQAGARYRIIRSHCAGETLVIDEAELIEVNLLSSPKGED
jgi:hypothetical protein